MISSKAMSAILVAMFLAMMASAAVGASGAPPSSQVSVSEYLLQGGNQIGFLANPIVYVNSTVGSFSVSPSGNPGTLTLTYGTYNFTVMPDRTSIQGNVYLTNKYSEIVNINQEYQTVEINITAISTVYGSVSVSGLNGQNVTVQFSTTEGYVFKTASLTSEPGVISSNIIDSHFPNTEFFMANIIYNGNTADGVQAFELALDSSGAATIYLGTNVVDYFGTVINKTSGTPVSSFSIDEVNVSKDYSYSKVTFSNGIFSIDAYKNISLYAVANGYEPMLLNRTVHTYDMVSTVSSIATKYNLSKNLKYANETIIYNLSYTAIPDVSYSYLPTLSLQINAINKSSTIENFTEIFEEQVLNSLPNNTYFNFQVNSSYYSVNKSSESAIKIKYNSTNLMAEFSVSYYNMNMSSKDYRNATMDIFARGYSYTPGKILYPIYVAYNNSTYSVKSATSSVTFGNPFEIYPVSKSTDVKVTLAPGQKPYFVISKIMEYYKGLMTSNTVLNSSSKNPIIIAPYNYNFSLNVSNAFYNPVTGQFEYNLPGDMFSWNVSGTMYSGYNITLNLTKSTVVTVTGRSSSGYYNSSNILIYVLNSSYAPFINMSYSVNGKEKYLNSTVTSTGKAQIYVMQNQAVTFDATASSLNVTINSVKYSISLYYLWDFPTFSTSGGTATYSFTTPSFVDPNQSFYLNVSSAGNTKTSLKVSVIVNDTTLPVPTQTLMYNGKNTSTITVGSPDVITANYTTDSYYPVSKLTFNWSFQYSNGTALPSGSYSVISYNVSDINYTKSNWVMVTFFTLNPVTVSLKVTDPSNLSAYSNVSYKYSYNGPQLKISALYFTGSVAQGVSSSLHVNVTNIGNSTATGISILIFDGSSLLVNDTFVSATLTKNQTKTFNITVNMPNSGSQVLKAEAFTSTQPLYIQDQNSLSKTISVGVNPYRIPIVIAVIVLIIVVIALVYYRYSTGRFPLISRKQTQQSQTMPVQQQKKQDTVQKSDNQGNKNNKKN
ncbi:hypothetical protein [Caldiplasma sukawensis]